MRRWRSVVRQWLKNKGFDRKAFYSVMLQTGTVFEKETNTIGYPRYSRATGELLGYKKRNITTGHQWNDPDGVYHSECFPLMWACPDSVRGSQLWILEGESDLFAVALQQPLPEDIELMAVPGVNAFPAEWVSLIEEYDKAVLFADNDKAGKQLITRVCGLVPTVRSATLPEGVNDVGDFLRDVGTIDDLLSIAKAAAPVSVEAPIRRFGWTWSAKEAGEYDDLLTTVIARDVQLKRKGRELVGLCPFHEEKTPSFHVNMEKGLFRCQGCGVGGDVITYVKKRQDLNYQMANVWLREFR